MLKFHQRLLFLICTITIISFIALGLIITHVVSETVTESHEKDLKHQAQHFVDLMRNHKKNQIESIADNKQMTVQISRNDQVEFRTHHGINFNDNINNKANPSTFMYDQYKNEQRYTYKTWVGAHTVIITGIDNQIVDLSIQIWKYIGLIGVFVLVIIFLVVRSINRTYIRPIKDVTYATSLLADGHYHIRVPESNVKETKALFITTNELARRLQKLNHQQKLQTHRLTTTLENIPSSILMIDKHGEIVVANQAYYHIFEPERPLANQTYEAALDKTLISYVAQGFRTEKPIYEQIQLKVKQVHEKYFDIAVVPILSSNKKNLYGMVLVLHDITNLKQLENMRREFVANVSHELKTPITSIKGFAETLQDGAKEDPNSLNEFLNIISKESERIESLVHDLLDLSHIEQQKTMPMTQVNLSAIAKETMRHLQHLAEQKEIHLKSRIEDNLYLEGNRDKLKQVCINLLSNAISYSSEGGEVLIRAYQEAQSYIVEIQDFGMGISETDQKRIFERFYRVDKARSRDSGGTGLGLSITKHIVEAHKGYITVQSELGEGSTFKVSLPQSE